MWAAILAMGARAHCEVGRPEIGDIGAAAAAVPAGTSVRVQWSGADHPSGVYYVKAQANLDVIIENLSADAMPLDGSIAFGPRGAGVGDFKPLSLTPIAPSTLASHERAKLPMAVSFGAAGLYELRWIHADKTSTEIASPAGVPLQAIFAPRGAGTPDTPWLTTLPRTAALVPGYLPDFVSQTTVRRFLIDERFAFDPAANLGLGLGASLGISSEQADALFTDAARAGAFLVLRVNVPVDHPPQAESIAAFRRYIVDAATRARGTLKGLVIVPELGNEPEATGAVRRAFRDFYLAGYDEAKKHDKNIAMLGAGSAQMTQSFLLSPSEPGKNDRLGAYLDAFAITDTTAQPAAARAACGDAKLPLWVLPPRGPDPWPLVPAAAALAEEAAIVAAPPPAIDRGVTEHLLGGSVFFQKIHPASLPYVATFQGDGYAVAAVAGLSAHTPMDALFPGLARTRTVVRPAQGDDQPPYPNVEVPDDSRSMRVVDASGDPVDCRAVDTLFVPAGDHILYLLRAGNAEDLAALLRPATTHHLPLMEIIAAPAVVSAGENRKPAITLRLTNISSDDAGGALKIVAPGTGENKAETTLGESDFAAISPGKSLDLTIALSTEIPGVPLIVEIKTRGLLQRTAIVLTREDQKNHSE
jgi:hypothetical protein